MDTQPPPRDPAVERGFLVPLMRGILKYTRWASLREIIIWGIRRTGRWPDDELVPFCFNELYVIAWLVALALLFAALPSTSGLWGLALWPSYYRLFDLAQALGHILFVESSNRWDGQIGYYLLVRDMRRWLLLTLVNLAEIVLCFSFPYLKWATEFEPELDGKMGALFQSATTFTGAGGYAAIGYHARLAVMLQLGYLVLFLVVVAPVVLSAFGAKQRTYEKFGEPTNSATGETRDQARPRPMLRSPRTALGLCRHPWVPVVGGLLVLLAIRRWSRSSWLDSAREEPVLR
jgi:hypothetical protein